MLIHVYSKMQLINSFIEQLKLIALKPTRFETHSVSLATAVIKESILLTQKFFMKGGGRDNDKLIDSWHKSINMLKVIGISSDELNSLYLKSRFWFNLEYWNRIDEKEEFLALLGQLDERIDKYVKKTKPIFGKYKSIPSNI